MRITRIKIDTFLVRIARTREEEASCDDCARLSARLVEVLAEQNVQDLELLAILQHLQECIPCAEEFQVLCDCARMDREEAWPSFEELWNLLQSGE